MAKKLEIPTDRIEKAILLIRGHKVRLDRDLAELYEIATKALNQAVSRNRKRFPEDFMFRLTAEETKVLRSQFVTLDTGRGKHLVDVSTAGARKETADRLRARLISYIASPSFSLLILRTVDSLHSRVRAISPRNRSTPGAVRFESPARRGAPGSRRENKSTL